MPKVNLTVQLNQLGHEVRRRRELLGMTLEDLADASGLTPNYIGTVETGKRDPSLSTVILLANGLGVKAGELFGPPPKLTPMAEEAARLFDFMPPGVQEAVVHILRVAVQQKLG